MRNLYYNLPRRPAKPSPGQQRRSSLRSEAWFCGEEHNVDSMVPQFEAAGWQVIGRSRYCTRLTSTGTRVPDIAALVRKYPEVSVFVRLYDKVNDSMKIIAGSTFVCAEALEDMHVFSHAEHYDVPEDANMFDY